MPHPIEALGRRREFDYIEIDWLERLTTGSAHEWDIYIVKELMDNALDADEAHGLTPHVDVQMVYEAEGLEVRVSNLAPFPTEHLERFFNLQEYFTLKDYFNIPTRGAQGNALKTILGIPYALRYLFFKNYKSLYKPLAVTTGNQEYVVRLTIDECTQSIHPQIEPRTLRKDQSGAKRRDTARPGTEVFVGIDRFRQQRPRTLTDLHRLALAYALWNPHASITWNVNIGGEQAQWVFAGDPQWRGKWSGASSPISWYDYGQFRQICFAFLREYGADYPLADLLGHFTGLDSEDGQGQAVLDKLSARTGRSLVTLGDLQLGQTDDRLLRDGLYPLMKSYSLIGEPATLGYIGQPHIEAVLHDNFPIQGDVFYERVAVVNKDRPSVPFVLEVVLAEFAADQKGSVVSPRNPQRQIWFSINHTPTYQDPFYVKHLPPPDRPTSEPVLGLDGFMDHYGLDPNTPIILAVHLICPNIHYQNYGKSQIDDEPFTATLCQTLHTVITRYQEARKEQELDLRPIVWEMMPGAIGEVSSSHTHSFTQGQLIHCLKLHIASKAEEYAAWVNRPEANARLAALIADYQQERGLISGLVRPLRGHITLPDHPNDQITLALGRVHALGSFLRRHGANKLLCVANPEIEDLLVTNQFHNRYDLAILRSDGDFTTAFGEMINRLGQEPGVPILLLHDASVESGLLLGRLQRQLTEAGVDVSQFIDLGLTPSQGQALELWSEVVEGSVANREQLEAAGLSSKDIALLIDEKRRIGLESFTPDGLACWFEARLAELALPLKAVPPAEIIQRQALRRLREKLGWQIEAIFHEVVRLPTLQDHICLGLQAKHGLTELGFPELVQQQLAASPQNSWEQTVEKVTDDVCEEVLRGQASEEMREQMIQYWRGGGHG